MVDQSALMASVGAWLAAQGLENMAAEAPRIAAAWAADAALLAEFEPVGDNPMFDVSAHCFDTLIGGRR